MGNVPNADDQEIRSYNNRHAVALDEQAGKWNIFNYYFPACEQYFIYKSICLRDEMFHSGREEMLFI